jgi:uncharacterized membrane protein YhaH (DUF805 family)
MIHIDDEVELIFANSRPVDISSAGGINCMGCNILIEFFDNPEPITKTVIRTDTKFEEISNTGEEYSVEFLSDGAIGELKFIDELNYLSFDVNQENQLFLIKIPLDLLLSPYHVFLSEIDQDILVDSDQIRKSEFKQTATHANLSFKANMEGVIHIVGSTEMEHEKLLDKLEKRIPEPVEETIENVKKSDEELNDTTKEQLFEDWGDTSSNVNNNEDNTMIFVIIAGVVITYADMLIGTYNEDTESGLIAGIFGLATVIPGIAVGVRRLHDINKTGWWVLFAFLFFWLLLIPILLLLYWATRPGDQGDNKYGPEYQSIES